jgi:hypothetical protein
VHVALTAEYVFVEGVFTIATPEDAVVPSATSTVKITLVEPADGATDLVFTSIRMPMMAPHSVGVKAFAVMGGQLDFRGLPADTCPAWLKLADIIHDPAVTPASVLQPTPPPAGCSYTTIATTFATATERDGWRTDGGDGAVLSFPTDPDGTTFARVSERGARWNGLLRYALDKACLVPNEKYYFVAKVRTGEGVARKVDAGITASPSGSWYWVDEAKWQPDDGWIELYREFEFTETDLTDPASALELQFYNPNAGDVIDVASVRLVRLTPAVFQPAGVAHTCHQLARNGGMDADERFYAPWDSSSSSPKIHIEPVGSADASARYLRMTDRTSSGHYPYQYLEVACLEPRSTYAISARVRLPADAACTAAGGARDSCARIELVTIEDDGAWRSLNVAAQTSFNAGVWNDVRGELLMSDYHKASNREVFVRLRVDDGGAAATVDWDALSIEFVSGPVRTLVLSEAASPCWAAGAELLVTSHTTWFEDAQTAQIESVAVVGGKARVRLTSAIARPTTLSDSADFAVEVALLSRNVAIEGALDGLDATRIGGHLMVMHTEGIAQTLHGVKFERMGQQGNLGRYPIHMYGCCDDARAPLARASRGGASFLSLQRAHRVSHRHATAATRAPEPMRPLTRRLAHFPPPLLLSRAPVPVPPTAAGTRTTTSRAPSSRTT